MSSFEHHLNLQSLAQHVTFTNTVASIVGLVVLRRLLLVVYALFLDPLRDVPGPFLARFTRLWELREALSGTIVQTLLNLHKKHAYANAVAGPVIRIAPNMYSFSQPDDCKIIYTTSVNKAFTKTHFYNTNGDPKMPNIFNMKDEKVHSQRKRSLASLYNMSTMVHYEEAVNTMNSILVRKFDQYAATNQELALPAFMQYYAFDVNNEFGMMEKEGDVDDFIDFTRQAVLYMAFVGLFPELHPLFLWLNKVRGVRHAGTAIVSIARASIEKALGGEGRDTNVAKSDAFHSKLARLLRSEQINHIEATDSIGSNIAAGSDTTAITLSAAFYYIYRNPEVLAKLRSEIDQRSDPVTFEQSQTMPYLQAVINETLRIHPAVGYALRREVPAGGTVLAGRQFPGGTHVGVSGWVLHQNESVSGPDAGLFRPERWLEDASKGNAKTAMSFAVIPQIIRKFDLIFDENPWELNCHWFVWPQYKVRIQLRHKDEAVDKHEVLS
ncbi:hypothetical protein FOXYS1_5004 [Fusarium oxysporum]|uniref:Pisatin demethylase n=1 Tax=Fusarium oxysporum TaxID=5507 RepID=A0A8H5AFK3_FUSOX|nr:hypothetical protein FOXYS1_5004 [Fusarium oxysporum]